MTVMFLSVKTRSVTSFPLQKDDSFTAAFKSTVLGCKKIRDHPSSFPGAVCWHIPIEVIDFRLYHRFHVYLTSLLLCTSHYVTRTGWLVS